MPVLSFCVKYGPPRIWVVDLQVVLKLQRQMGLEFPLLNNAVEKLNIMWSHCLLIAIPAVFVAIINQILPVISQEPTPLRAIPSLVPPSSELRSFQGQSLPPLQLPPTASSPYLHPLGQPAPCLVGQQESQNHAAWWLVAKLRCRAFLACRSSKVVRNPQASVHHEATATVESCSHPDPAAQQETATALWSPSCISLDQPSNGSKKMGKVSWGGRAEGRPKGHR